MTDSKGRYIVYSDGGSFAIMLLRKERGYKLFDRKSAGAKRFSKMYRRRVEMP